MAEDLTTLDGFFKVRYNDRAIDLVPEHSDFAQAIKFDTKTILGERFDVPVRVRRPQGATFSAGGTAFALNDAIPGKMVNASVTPQSYMLRDQVAIDAIASATDNQAAFGNVLDEVVKDMENQGSFHRDLSLLYGQSNIGTFATSGSSAASQDYTLTVSSSAPGLMIQMEGANVDVYDPTFTTKRNAVGDLALTNVSIGTDGLTISFTLTGAAADNLAVATSDILVPKGWKAGSMVGIDKICKNTGVLFGVDAAEYSLWKANQIDAGGELNMLTLTRAAAMQVMRSGRKGKKLKVFVSYATWSDLNNNAAALRRFAESTKAKLDIGTENITYYGPGGAIEVVASGLVKNSEAFLGEWDSIKRVGASDLTFKLPGSTPGKERFFQPLEDVAAYELRMYWRQAIVPMRPACLTKITGIANSAL